MIHTCRLDAVLAPVVAMQWLGLSPRSGNFTPFRTASVSLASLAILSLTAGFYKSPFFLSVLSSGLAILYYIGRNIFDRKDFISLLETLDEMNNPFKEIKYTFSWPFLFLALEIITKGVVCYLKGPTIADTLVLIHCFKTIESRILVCILRYQSELLKQGELQDYRLICKALTSLRTYLLKQLPILCFLCFLWCSNAAFIGISSFSKILLTPDGSNIECLCYWLSFIFTIFSMVAFVSSYNVIKEQVDFEDRLYWKLVSSAQPQNLISAKHIMLFEMCSREKDGETLKIDNTLIYSIITSVGTFLVILVQFELEEIICGRRKENM